MNGADGHDAVREIARGLSQILNQALADGAQVRTLDAARDLAQLLSLRGLDRMLAALGPHAGPTWPPVLKARARAGAASGSGVRARGERRSPAARGRRAGAHAQTLERMSPAVVSADPRPAAVSRSVLPTAESAPVLLAAALEGLPTARGSEEVLRTVRLLAPVAGALRAALDWLLGDGSQRPRPSFTSDGTALEVTCEGIVYSGIHAASEVLAGVGAHLGPAVSRPGAWTVRVPIAVERETYLMLEQDELQLAVPWHAVARVKLMPTDAIDAMAQRKGLPVLEPLALAPRRAASNRWSWWPSASSAPAWSPTGLVWRMAAEEAMPSGAPPAPGIARAVRSDDGDLYWVLDPAWLLRGVSAPVLADTGHRSRPQPPPQPPAPPAPRRPQPCRLRSHSRRARRAATPGRRQAIRSGHWRRRTSKLSRRHRARPHPAATERARTRAAAARVGSRPARARPRLVAPAPRTAVPPPQGATAPPSASPAPTPRPRRKHGPRGGAGGRGFDHGPHLPRATARAARFRRSCGRDRRRAARPAALRSLGARLRRRRSPDARGRDFLIEMIRGAGATGSAAGALVRDADDERVAQSAGVAATLRKPYERDALTRVLARLVRICAAVLTRANGARVERAYRIQRADQCGTVHPGRG